MTVLNYTDFVPNPAPLASGATLQSYTDPTGEVWVAKGGVNNGQWKKARDVLHSYWYRAAALTNSTGVWVAMVLDTADYDDYGMFDGTTFTPPIVGVWSLNFQANLSAAATGQDFHAAWYDWSSTYYENIQQASFVYSLSCATRIVRRVTATSQTYAIRTYSRGSGAVSTGKGYTFCAIDYLGTG